MMKRVVEALIQSVSHFVYPMSCLHCHEQLPPSSPLLCDRCSSLLETLEPDGRCQACFNPKSSSTTHCQYCAKDPTLFFRMGAVFDYLGPAASIIKKMKYGNQPHLAKGAGAFLLAQLDKLDWEMPDAIVPVPITFMHWLDRGFNQSSLLAEEVAKVIKVPVWDALKRRSGSFSQAGLTVDQRRQMDKDQFKLKGSYPIQDKKILLIDDVMTTGTTLARCAELLYEKCPHSLYALTFCKAEK